MPTCAEKNGESDPVACSVQRWLLPSGIDHVHQGAMGSRRAHCKSTGLEISLRWADHHGCMEPADSIRRLGFARWYERRLIEGHAWFISVVFCMIAIAACMEELNFRGSVARLLAYVTLVAASVAI